MAVNAGAGVKADRRLAIAAGLAPFALMVLGIVGLVDAWPWAWLLLAAGAATSLWLAGVWRQTRIERAAQHTAGALAGERRYRDLFERSPLAIWEDDWSALKNRIDALKADGIDDIGAHLRHHPEETKNLMRMVKVVDFNAAAAELYAIDHGEAAKQNIETLQSGDGLFGIFVDLVVSFLNGEYDVVREVKDLTVDGRTVIVRTSISMPDTFREDWSRVVFFVEDNTEQKRSRERLAASEARYRQLFDQSPIGLRVDDWSPVKSRLEELHRKHPGRVAAYLLAHPDEMREIYGELKAVEVNAATLNIYGACDMDEFRAAVEMNPSAELLNATADGFDHVLRGDFLIHRDEIEESRIDGTAIYTRATIYVPEEFRHDWSRVMISSEDVTAVRRAHEAVLESEQQYRDLFEQSPVAIWENDWSPVKREVDRLLEAGVDDLEAYLLTHWDEACALIETTRIVAVNRAAVAMYGLERADQLTKVYVLDVTDSEIKAFCRRVGVFARGEGPTVLETVDTRFDNTEIHIRTTSDVSDNARDDWSRVVHIVEDITERRTAQRDLGLSEQRYRGLFEQSPVSIWVEDWSQVKPMVDNLRQVIGDNVGTYLETHPDFVAKAYDAMQLVDINEAGWRLMGANSKEQLMAWADGDLHEADRAQTTKILTGFAEGRSRVEVDDNQDFTLDDRGIFVRGVSFLPPEFLDDWSRVIHVFEDTTARHAAEQRVRESGQLLELAQHMTGHGHFVYDVELDRMVNCSAELARIFGISREDFLVSQSESTKFVHPDDRDRVAAKLTLTARDREPVDLEFRVLRPDGTVRHVHEVSEFLVDENGLQTSRRIGTIDDITERRETEEALRRARDEAEHANRSKSEFLANVSHELRTPLNAIIGFSDVLLDGTFGEIENPRYREYIGDINDSGRHLLELINDILDLSKAEAGRLELSEEEIVIDRLIRQSVRLVHDRAERSGIEIGLELPAGLPLVRADARKLRQVLLNLLSNAVKFTPAGGDVTVRAALLATGEFDITVADSGIGMQAADIDRAFEVFGQVDSALARRFEGTGLGLPLARAIVELHDGALLIDSQPEGGTKVTVRLPADRVMPGLSQQTI